MHSVPAPSLMIARNHVVAVNVPVLCVVPEPKPVGVPLTKPLLDDCHTILPAGYPELGDKLNVVLPLLQIVSTPAETVIASGNTVIVVFTVATQPGAALLLAVT